jgi:predicted nucleotidyltransferase
MNRTKDGIAGVFKTHEVVLAYLFGSQQDAGRAFLEGKSFPSDETSDLDIGILFQAPPSHPYRRYGALYADLSDFFESFKIDIVFLHEVHSLLKYEIIKGVRIYAADEEWADAYEDLVIKFAADLNVKRRMFEPDFIEAVENGHFEIEHR